MSPPSATLTPRDCGEPSLAFYLNPSRQETGQFSTCFFCKMVELPINATVTVNRWPIFKLEKTFVVPILHDFKHMEVYIQKQWNKQLIP